MDSVAAVATQAAMPVGIPVDMVATPAIQAMAVAALEVATIQEAVTPASDIGPITMEASIPVEDPTTTRVVPMAATIANRSTQMDITTVAMEAVDSLESRGSTSPTL